jgi:hypothetical protein
MAIFRDVVLTWKGVDYTVTPSMRLMRSIEMGDISLTDIAVRAASGRPPVSHLAYVISKMLQSSGLNVSEDEVYSEIMGGKDEEIGKLFAATLTAFMPDAGEEKNNVART